ncbi:MAG: hypothetical protein WD847_07630 [Pirellulales bacterium]
MATAALIIVVGVIGLGLAILVVARPTNTCVAIRFSLRQMLLWTACVAVLLGLFVYRAPSGTGYILSLPVFAVWLAIVGVRYRHAQWHHLAFAVAAGFAIATVVEIELASGYGSPLPIIGQIPGPPSKAMQAVNRALMAMFAGFGFWQSIYGVRKGKGLLRMSCAMTGLVLGVAAVGMIVSILDLWFRWGL